MISHFKNRIKEYVVMSALLFLMPLAVFGEMGVGEQNFSIGPRGTLSTPKDADEGQWFAGAQARLHMSPRLALEASIDYRRNYFKSFTSVKSYPVQVSMMTYFMPGSQALSPYALAGIGWYYTEVDGPALFHVNNSRFGLHAGAGLEVKLTDGLSVDAGYRYVWLEKLTSVDANELDKTYEDSGSMVTVGFNFLF